MRTNDISLEDILTSRNDTRSLDPDPARDGSMDLRVLKDLISDHMHGLRRLSKNLPRSDGLEQALTSLELEYEKLLGRRLNELTNSTSQTKSAVLDLRRQLTARSKESDPDLSYGGIDLLMKRICKRHGCSAQALHDAFVDSLLCTPDQWIRDRISK